MLQHAIKPFEAKWLSQTLLPSRGLWRYPDGVWTKLSTYSVENVDRALSAMQD
ncbi:protein of unknown function [Paenibacillus alvei]|uniref:Uncharacterized protein n=1 Tax=Paenibacillus alvei TaxID=44250 RepID=A0A383RI41_PAEAL|nr:protein of unknown function [Paenibacillus alvei]